MTSKNDETLTEGKVKKIVLAEMERYKDAMSKAMAHAIVLNNDKITEQLKQLGVIK